MGLVVPARAVTLQPRVAGQIIGVMADLEPGGIVEADSTIVTIDPADYELAVRQREADLAERRAQLASQQVDFESRRRLHEDRVISTTEFAAAEAAHESALAQVANAEAALERARLDLSRTSVTVPFDALVVEENSEIGAMAGTSTDLAELVGIDRFWVELSVPVDDLKWIELPHGDKPGSEVLLSDPAAWGPDEHRTGRIVRFTSSVDEQSRMATLLVEVMDPLGRTPENEGAPSLLIGSYLRGDIMGRVVPDTVAIDRRHLRSGNSAWVMDEDGRLQIRDVEIAWRGPDEVYVADGLEEGDLLVTSNLPTPVEGMRLRTSSAAEVADSVEEPGHRQVAASAETVAGEAR